MNISVVSRQALKAVVNEPNENKLHIAAKVIRDVEKIPDESSHRLCQDLRAVLRSVQKAQDASASQVALAGTLLLRVKEIDPRRRLAADEVEEVIDDTPIVAGTSASQIPAPKEPEVPPLTLEKVQEAVSAVDAALWESFKTVEYNTAGRNCNLLSIEQKERVLRGLLGELPLSFANVRQLKVIFLLELLNQKKDNWTSATGGNTRPLLWIADDYCDRNRPSPSEQNCRGVQP